MITPSGKSDKSRLSTGSKPKDGLTTSTIDGTEVVELFAASIAVAIAVTVWTVVNWTIARPCPSRATACPFTIRVKPATPTLSVALASKVTDCPTFSRLVVAFKITLGATVSATTWRLMA